jgi:hypothetical protein
MNRKNKQERLYGGGKNKLFVWWVADVRASSPEERENPTIDFLLLPR